MHKQYHKTSIKRNADVNTNPEMIPMVTVIGTRLHSIFVSSNDHPSSKPHARSHAKGLFMK